MINNQIWKRWECVGYFSVSSSHGFSQEYCYILFLPQSSSFWITNRKTLGLLEENIQLSHSHSAWESKKYLCMSLTSGLGTTHCLQRLTRDWKVRRLKGFSRSRLDVLLCPFHMVQITSVKSVCLSSQHCDNQKIQWI